MRGGRSAQRLSMRPAQNPLRRQDTRRQDTRTRANTLPIAFFAINDSPSCPAPIAQHNAAQRSTSQHLFFTTAPSEHITPRRFLPSCIDSLLRAGKSLTLSASAFFFSSLCPPSAAFNFNLKTCWFIRVGGTSDMVAFLFSGKMPLKRSPKSSGSFRVPLFRPMRLALPSSGVGATRQKQNSIIKTWRRCIGCCAGRESGYTSRAS